MAGVGAQTGPGAEGPRAEARAADPAGGPGTCLWGVGGDGEDTGLECWALQTPSEFTRAHTHGHTQHTHGCT